MSGQLDHSRLATDSCLAVIIAAEITGSDKLGSFGVICSSLCVDSTLRCGVTPLSLIALPLGE